MRFLSVVLCLCVCAAAGKANAATINVSAGGDLQAAIDAAQPGDTILLPAGAVFTGNYTLPAKNGLSYITIRSATPDLMMPSGTVRIDPSWSSALPKIRSTQNGPAFKTVGPASYWKLLFLEILPSVSNSAANLIELGSVGSEQPTLSAVPHHLIIDRCYIHGVPEYEQRRGIALNSGETMILNSYISEIKGQMDTQAIAGWNGPGPYLIENNYLEAGAENIMFGGADPTIQNLVPSNIKIRRNHITKQPNWVWSPWTLKNLIELKNADTVLIEGNTMENNWAAGQQGYSLVFTPRNQEYTAPWSVVQNITVQHNVIRHVAAVFNILGYDNNATSRQTNNILIRNNVVFDVSTAYSTPGNGANGWFAIMGNGPRDITFDHNTVDNDGDDTILFYEATPPASTEIYGVTITNNLLRDNAYGIFGANSQEGMVALNAYAPGATVLRNAIADADSRYPAGNAFPSMAQWMADFVNRDAGNYQLVSTSASRGAALDGTDIGANPATIYAVMAGTPPPAPVPDPPPPPSPAPGSSPYTGSPIALPGRFEAEDYDTGGEGLAYHDSTSGNSSGAYRNDDVDIRPTTDTSGSYNIKSVRGGEWLAYTVNVAAAGSYTFSFRVASSGTGGTVHLAVDDVDVSGPIALPDTGGWNAWQTVTKSGVSLPAGTHVLKFVVDANGSAGTAADVNWISAAASGAASVSTPYSGSPAAVPSRIEAENYDNGGEGRAYHDTTAGNASGAYRSDDVDIRVTTDASGSYNVKGVRAGEWLAYTVNVGSSGTYALDLRVASSGGGGTVHFTLDGTDVTGAIVLPDTGGWNTWTTVTTTGVSLPAGSHVLRLVMDANGPGGTIADINWFAIR